MHCQTETTMVNTTDQWNNDLGDDELETDQFDDDTERDQPDEEE